jgi:RND family efflux transporter MFP subunit
MHRFLLRPLAAAVPLMMLAACQPALAPVEPIRAVRVLTVGMGQAEAFHEYAAEVRARTESRLAFRVAGKLVRRQAELGQAVRAGQPLAQLDPQDLKLAQDTAQAALRAAQANLDLSAAEFAKFKELREQNFISALELERRETALKAARAQLEQARAQAGVQGNLAGYAALVADTAGIVTGIDAEPGAVLAAGTPVLRLAHDGPRDAVFSVPEDQVGALRALIGKPGALKVRLWGDDARAPLAATLREVAAAADPATRTFLAKADLGGQAAARLGQTASVRVDRPAGADVVKLPLAAVAEAKGAPVVWLLDRASMTVQPKPIQVAGADGNQVVVAGGVSPGQMLVAAGVHLLTPGQKVKLYAEPGQPAPPVAAAPASAASR